MCDEARDLLAGLVNAAPPVETKLLFLTCSQQADTQTLLAVMAEERKVHEIHIARAANR